MAIRITATGSNIIVERIPDDAIIGSIHIPDAHRKNGDAYFVHAVGPDAAKGFPEVVRGSRVVIKEHAVTPFELDGRKLGRVAIENVVALLGVPSE